MADTGGGPEHDVDAALLSLTDDQRRRAAADERRRRHWLIQQAGEEGTFVGVLVDLSESGRRLKLDLVSGHRLDGRVAALGEDFVVVRSPRHRFVVPLRSLAAVHDEPGARSTVGDRTAPDDRSLAEVLAEVVEVGSSVVVHAVGGHDAAGTVISVGRDLLGVRSPEGVHTYVSVRAVGHLTVDPI